MDKDNERILLANVIGECIKSLQLDKNINQKELALLSGVSERSLRRIERGQVNVNVYVLRQLVMALGEEMPDFWRIVEKNMELMGEEFPHVRKRVADKVLRDNKNNKMGGDLITKNIYQIYLNFHKNIVQYKRTVFL